MKQMYVRVKYTPTHDGRRVTSRRLSVLTSNRPRRKSPALCKEEGRAVVNGKKKSSGTSFPKKARGHSMCSTMVGGGWRLAVGGGWRLAVGNWRLVAVGGGWRRLVVGDWWLVAVGSGWQLAVGRRWGSAAVGGWRLVAVGGWRLVAVGGC